MSHASCCRRAFAAATVHDMFNWLSVLVFLPLEWATRYLYHLTSFLTRDIVYDPSSADNPEFLKAVTKPFTDRIVMVGLRVVFGVVCIVMLKKTPILI